MANKRTISHSIGHSTSRSNGHSTGEAWSVSPDCEIEYQLHRLAKTIGLVRHDGEDNDAFASRCHDRIDTLIRVHGDHRIHQLMDLHDEIARLVP